MALNIQIPYKGSDYLFQGISGAGQSMGGALEQVINKYKRDQDQGKAADYFYKSLGDGAEGMTGIHPEEWKTLGSKDKAQAMVGFMQSQTLKQLQAKMQQEQAQAQMLQQRAQEQQAEGEALPQFMQQYDQMGGLPGQGNMGRPPSSMDAGTDAQELGPIGGDAMPGDPGGPMGLPPLPGVPATDSPPWLRPDGGIAPAPASGVDRVMQAMARVGRVSPRLGAAMARIILPHVLGATTEGSLTPSYTEDPVTGARNITFGKQLQSTGFNPAKSAPQLIPMHDDDGNLTGWSHVDIRGKSTYQPFKGNAKFPPATDPQGNPIAGFYLDPNNGKPVDARTTIQKLSGAGGTATGMAAAQGKGKPTRAVAAKYVKDYGKAGAAAALKKDGYDPSGYSD